MHTTVERAIKALGLEDQTSDPAIIETVLETYQLHDLQTENEVIRRLLRRARSTPQSLMPLVRCIGANLSNHPAIIEFLEHALEWLSPSPHVTRALHTTYILEALVSGMNNDASFFAEVHDHLKRKERERGIDTRRFARSFLHALGITHSLFKTIKAFSVDPAMTYLRVHRTGDLHGLTKLERRLIESPERELLDLITLNIYEAGITDHRAGRRSNARCAHALSRMIEENQPSVSFEDGRIIPRHACSPSIRTSPETRILNVPVGNEWMRLYVAWNLAFVTGALDDWDLVIPKLLIPSIIGSKPEHFIQTRIISLWLTANTAYFRSHDRRSIARPAHHERIADAWGAINERSLSRTYIESADRFYAHPYRNWLRIAKRL